MYFNIKSIEMPNAFIADGVYFSMMFNAAIFYLNYGFLVGKKLFSQPKLYLLLASSVWMLVSFLETLADIYQLNAIAFLFTSDVGLTLLLYNFQVNAGYWVLSIVLKLTVDWLSQINSRKEIELQQTETELALLKSQVHPHFLFNTLNTLFSSAYEYGDTNTADGIGKLSHLLRYMLYETQEKKVKLENEIEYLENYIDLQKMRFSKEVSVIFNVEGKVEGYYIAPMMLITLVENAFKHGISPAVKTEIEINLEIQNNKLFFQVINVRLRARAKTELEGSSGGLGLVNLKKRLDLLYPQKHSLDTHVLDNNFVARLELL